MIVLVSVAGAPELVYVTLSTYLQHNTRSEFRATSMSIAEGCFSIQMLWLFPLVGYVVQHSGYGIGFGLCAGLMAAGAGLFIASQRLPGLEPAPATIEFAGWRRDESSSPRTARRGTTSTSSSGWRRASR